MDKKIKNKIILITGLPGSGKTTIASLLKKKIIKVLGPTIVINGDDIRNIFNFKNYTIEDRAKLDEPYLKLAKFIYHQKINVILTSVSINDKVRLKLNKKNIFLFIHINTDLKSRKIFKKKIYAKKNNVPGKSQIINKPKNVDIFVNNNSRKRINDVTNTLWKKMLNFLQ